MPALKKGSFAPPGAILEVARSAGLELTQRADKAQCKCPFHQDSQASAVLFTDTNWFHCSACGESMGLYKFASKFGVRVDSSFKGRPQPIATTPAKRPVKPSKPKPKKPAFHPEQAQQFWRFVKRQARDDDNIADVQPVFDYLHKRGLMEACELGLVGTLGTGHPLPRYAQRWTKSHRLIVALYDEHGVLSNIQARAIDDAKPKTLFPPGSHASGMLFADSRGVAMLRNEESLTSAILGEGLTDFLAMAIYSPIPVLSAPGTGMAKSAAGAWARGMTVFIATDIDEAGQRVVQQTAEALFECGAAKVRRLDWPSPYCDACEALEGLGDVRFSLFLEEHLSGEVTS